MTSSAACITKVAIVLCLYLAPLVAAQFSVTLRPVGTVFPTSAAPYGEWRFDQGGSQQSQVNFIIFGPPETARSLSGTALRISSGNAISPVGVTIYSNFGKVDANTFFVTYSWYSAKLFAPTQMRLLFQSPGSSEIYDTAFAITPSAPVNGQLVSEVVGLASLGSIETYVARVRKSVTAEISLGSVLVSPNSIISTSNLVGVSFGYQNENGQRDISVVLSKVVFSFTKDPNGIFYQWNFGSVCLNGTVDCILGSSKSSGGSDDDPYVPGIVIGAVGGALVLACLMLMLMALCWVLYLYRKPVRRWVASPTHFTQTISYGAEDIAE